MVARYKVTLTEKERGALETMTRSGKIPAKKFLHARILLLCDAGEHGDPWTVAKTAEAMGVSQRTVEHLKKRFVEEGLDSALIRKASRKPRDITFDGAFDARLISIACSKPPDGRVRWTLRLLADKAVELKLADSVSVMTVQRSLKKTNCVLT